MALADDQQLTWHDDFYRDRFPRVVVVILGVLLALGLLAATSISLYLAKPAPLVFGVADEWRVQAPVPLEQAYLPLPDLLQWVSRVVPDAFDIDFMDYESQLKVSAGYFTQNGWSVFLSQLNNYVDQSLLVQNRQFVSCRPTGAPFVINQGVLSGRYAWWVQIPIAIAFSGAVRTASKPLTLQVLVVRVPTDNNLMGVAIDNVIVLQNNANNPSSTGAGS
ncbi:MAG TPA: DotI/IcmL family type IV secretion protein [Gammaproteobacteria bacterium]|jgi:intracellular multiplication protein IcmL|nr:DotI/IcmL family type IV secretion protein [Gammaproteobacteria bacterium]